MISRCNRQTAVCCTFAPATVTSLYHYANVVCKHEYGVNVVEHSPASNGFLPLLCNLCSGFCLVIKLENLCL